MSRFLLIPMIAVAIASSSASVWAGPITHYNQDWQTKPNGPIQLVNASAVESPSGVWTLTAGAQNNDVVPYYDVKFLVQFIYDSAAGLSFNDATDTWSGGGNSATIGGSSGTFSMMNTDAPLSWTVTSPTTRTATLGASDTVPYIQIGNIAAGQTVNFSLTLNQTPRFVPFNLVGSFVAVPEPSSIALALLGAVGLAVLARRRRR